MSQEELSNIINRLDRLELQAQQVATAIATERENLRRATATTRRVEATAAAPAPPQRRDVDTAPRPIQAGDRVRFSGTRIVRGGTGTVIGFTNGREPFLRIRRDDHDNDRRLLGRGGDIVKRKPHTVQRIQ